MDLTDLMRQCNGHAPPSKALVKGLAKELDLTEGLSGERGGKEGQPESVSEIDWG